MRERKKSGIGRAVLIALAAGALVAYADPARPIAHDASIALESAAALTTGAAHFARNEIIAPAVRRA